MKLSHLVVGLSLLVARSAFADATPECDACMAANCSDAYNYCATDAPNGTGLSCLALFACYDIGSGDSCAESSTIPCYCGSSSLQSCIIYGPTDGQCQSEAQAAGCNGNNMCVWKQWYNNNYALGRANWLVECLRDSCVEECNL